VKSKAAASTHKKVIVEDLSRKATRGYLNPARLGLNDTLDLLNLDGEHLNIALRDVRCVYFVREFTDDFQPERKSFLSRPKLDGLWVRLKFRDNDLLEGIVANNLLDLLDRGVHLTPPDLHGESVRLFIPRTALAEMSVLGVVGIQRRPRLKAAEAPQQTRLFGE
jgi:hypothetical protein